MSESDNSTVGQASPEEVREFLEASKRIVDKEKEEETKEVTYDIKDLLEKNKNKEQEFKVLEGVTPEEMAAALGLEIPKEEEDEDMYDSPQSPPDLEELDLKEKTSHVRDSVNRKTRGHKNQKNWAESVADLGDIVVTELEKRLFLKAAVHDVNMVFPIALESLPDTPVTCRSLFEWELSLIFSALADDIREGLARNEEEYFSNIQNYSLCMQIEKVGETVYRHKFTAKEDGELLQEVKRLRAHMYKHIREMSSVQKTLVFTALRIFHAKYDICQRKLRDKNFWIPRD